MSPSSQAVPGTAGSAPSTAPLPRVSVAMCTCNGERYLDEQIASVLGQQGVQVELVVGDDASTDGTWPLLQAWAGRSAAVRILRHPRRLGLHANLAAVLGHCQADLIAPCDQDDIWLPHKLARLCAALDGGHLLAYGDSALVDADGHSLEMNLSGRFSMYSGSGVLPLWLWNSVSGHAMLFQRRLLDTALPFADGMLPDWWLAICAANAGSIAYVDTPLVQYRQHSASQTDVAQRKRAPRDSWRIHAERGARLQAMAALPGPDQAYLQQLSLLWAERSTTRWCWALVRLMAQRRQQLMQVRRRGGFARFALQMLLGQRWRTRQNPTPP
jgi:hypothetical protein